MSISLNVLSREGVAEAVSQLGEATAAKKCWRCGCLHNSLRSLEDAIPAVERPAALDAAIRAAREKLVPVQYECLGCEVCYPPLAMNALGVGAEACPGEEARPREGWPPLPGSYTVLRFRAPVAIATLTDEALAETLAKRAGPEVSIVGSVFTENLGIERIIRNIAGNPNIRFLILCGADSRQTIGHLPGQSLLALATGGVDARGRIVGAEGKRPLLRNVTRDAVEHFRRSVEVVDLVGVTGPDAILSKARECADRDPGPAEPFEGASQLTPLRGYVPERMVSDPAGYFVVYPDRVRGVLQLEHYANTGVLDTVIEAASAAEAYVPAVERGLVSRLDHAAYLGRELARAERSLITGEPFIQDAAPERTLPSGARSNGNPNACGCGSSCGDKQP